jgi:hypothetical protein
MLEDWQHPYAEKWVLQKIKAGELTFAGDPPEVSGEAVWRQLLKDECDKLYNQAWSAYEHLKEAQESDDPDSAFMIAIDDFPSAVEQAWSLAPEFAGEHLELLRKYRVERYQDFLRALGVGTDREDAERAECLAFWEDNAEIMTEFRKKLYRLVRAQLAERAG